MGSNIYDEKMAVIKCESAEKCGSCAYAGMKYDNELKIKQGYVDKLFKDICPVDKITGMYRPVHYRNKVHAVVGEDKNGNIITGTYEENSHNIVPVSDCLLEDSHCSSIIATLRDLFKSFKYKPYNEDKGTGFIRHILLRKGFSTKEIMLVIVTADVAFPSKTHFLKALKEKHPDEEWDFTILKSGPLGGDQQMGSRIVDGQIDYLFFFTDPMTLQPHDTDVKALTRLAGVENIVFCCNRSTADHIISSPLFMDPDYERIHPDYSSYTKRFQDNPVVTEAVESVNRRKKKRK